MSVMLIVDHLPLQFTSGDLRAVTERLAPLIKCWVVRRPGGPTTLGFGYIEVPTSGDAEAVITGLNGVILDGRPVNVTILKTA